MDTKNVPEKISIAQALDLGVAHIAEGSYAKAIGIFRGVLMLEPENFEAMQRLGSLLFDQAQYFEAMFLFWRGRKLGRRHPLAISNYATCLSQLGYPQEAIGDLERAAVLAEKGGVAIETRAQLWNNLGNTLERLRRHKEALIALDKGIALQPNKPFQHYNRGITLLRLNRHQEAFAALERCVELHQADPDPAGIADAYYNRGVARLSLGDLKGFADYEYRLTTTENEKPNLGFPAAMKWQREPMGELPLFIVAEQGLGDTIQFLRFIPALREKAGKIALAVQSALAPMVHECWPDIKLYPANAEIPHDQIGAWMALMSAPNMLGIEAENELPPPWQPPADEPDRVLPWMVGLIERPRVGICWAGNFLHKNDADRSIALTDFAKLLGSPCNFVSIQQVRDEDKDELAALADAYPFLKVLTLEDFRDTAAVIRSLDLVITVDTSVAHLAASIGKPTWILIPAYNTDWRWMRERSDSPWYPSVRLYRQERAGDWKSVLDRVRADLTTFAAAFVSHAA